MFHQQRAVTRCLLSVNAAAGAALTPEGALGSSQGQPTALLCAGHSLFGLAQTIVVPGVCLAGPQAVLGFKPPSSNLRNSQPLLLPGDLAEGWI